MKKRAKENKLWTHLFGIKIGDLVRFKWGKVKWQVYAIGEYLRTDGITSRYYKLRRRSRGWRGGIVYEEVWDWDTRFQEIEHVDL